MSINKAPVARTLVHQREVICRGYAREDGLWDIEGYLCDTKPHSVFLSDRGEVKPHEPIHEMRLCLTLDTQLLIHDARAEMLNHPHRVCPAITGAYRSLVGMRIGAGFLSAARQRFRGVNGCTHLSELIGPVATTAFQALWDRLGDPGEGGRRDGWQVGGCHALRADGEIVREQFPALYRPAE